LGVSFLGVEKRACPLPRASSAPPGVHAARALCGARGRGCTFRLASAQAPRERVSSRVIFDVRGAWGPTRRTVRRAARRGAARGLRAAQKAHGAAPGAARGAAPKRGCSRDGVRRRTALGCRHHAHAARRAASRARAPAAPPLHAPRTAPHRSGARADAARRPQARK
jgi:hypothetical protein